MLTELERVSRLERLLESARVLKSANTSAGRKLRQHLLETSGLSQQGLELALERALETSISPVHLTTLLSRSESSARAHVVLSANVCTAALRAIALALVSAERVLVRPSRRDPALAQALHAVTPELFELVSELEPSPGDEVWAYGSDETLAELRTSLPRGVRLHAHGHGFGVAVIEPESLREPQSAQDLALDTVLFDQNGCLSPRCVLLASSASEAHRFARELAHALSAFEHEVPPGPRSSQQLAELRRFADTASYALETLPAGSGLVTLASERVLIPPALRLLHLTTSSDPVQMLLPFASSITAVGLAAGSALETRLRVALPHARFSSLGQMQTPPLDGPVDRRTPLGGELL